MKTIAVLRANPKDVGFGKILETLSKEFKVECYIWDRTRDFNPIVDNENISYKRCIVYAGYYSFYTFLKMILFEVWLFLKLIVAKIDYIHAIDLDTGFAGLIVARLRGKSFIYQCLDPYYSILPTHWPKFLGKIARRIENMVISQADTFIITDLLRMPQHEGANPRTVVEIANVPILNQREIEYDHDRNEFVVGYIGALAKGRNLLTIIDAVGELNDEGVRLIIGGFGPIGQSVEKSSKKYSNVTYIGSVPYLLMNSEVLRIEGTFALLLYISDPANEGQKWVSPNKLFESMALGKPIIVGEGTLVADRVSDIGNGIVIKYGSKEELKRAILRFKNNPQLIKEMGEKGKSEFEKNWRPEIMVRRLLEAYRKLIK